MFKKAGTKNNLMNMVITIVLFCALVAAIVVFCVLSPTINNYFDRREADKIPERIIAQGTDLCEEIASEGIVLLKNKDNALPLTKDEIRKINVFGWAAYDWLTGGFGSGFSNTELERLKLFPALEKAGIEYNKSLEKMYREFYSKPASDYGGPWDEYRGDVSVSGQEKYFLHEPGKSYYTDEIIRDAKSFSDTALVVIGRAGGEGQDMSKYQQVQAQLNMIEMFEYNYDRHYLQLTEPEEEMIAAAKKACGKVIVVLNTSNTMELGFVDDDEIDACLLVGLTGLSGTKALIDILKGDVNPSGRTADTYAYKLESSPSYVTSGYYGAQKYAESDVQYGTKDYYDAYVDYTDDIYVGYRYYETAAAEGFIDYNKVVQYPFGYGLSYTEFEWTVDSVAPSPNAVLAKDGTVEMTVTVKNIGQAAGKDVVQLYYTPPYIQGEIEKPHVVLGAFAKTPLLQPGDKATVNLKIHVQDIASYDCYDKNGNGHKGYELDKGQYLFKLQRNSHKVANVASNSTHEAEVSYSIDGSGYTYSNDRITNAEIKNRFTGSETVDGMSIDGADETETVTYMTRSNFTGTFPKRDEGAKQGFGRSRNEAAFNLAKEQAPSAAQLKLLGDIAMPVTGAEGSLTFTDSLSANGYNDSLFESLLNQITKAEMFNLLRDSFFKTNAISSIAKPEYTDLDGPAGLNTRIFDAERCRYVLYPNQTLIAQSFNLDLALRMGESLGDEANYTGVKGIYAPGANIHRSPFGARNFEYFSEDPLVSGMFAGNIIKGAKQKGLYCYIKHFAVNETDTMREGLFTWLTEQNLREIYLRPFEIAVKEFGANAVMSSMNRLGAVWTGGSRALCTDVLRGEWGFRGAVISDWVDENTDYMPAFKGLFAGNDLWLNNKNKFTMFDDSDYADNAAFVTLARNAAHNVLYMYADTEQAKVETLDLNQKGSRAWIWGATALSVLLASGFAFMSFTTLKKHKQLQKAEKSVDEKQSNEQS